MVHAFKEINVLFYKEKKKQQGNKRDLRKVFTYKVKWASSNQIHISLLNLIQHDGIDKTGQIYKK